VTIDAPIGVGTPLPGVVYPPLAALETYVQAGLLRHETWPEIFSQVAQAQGERPAIVGPDGTISYRDLDSRTTRLAGALISMGLQPNDRVMFQLGNCAELIIGVLGCVKAGLIPVCTLASHREHEIGYLAKHCKATAHFVQGDDQKFDHVAFAQVIRAKLTAMRFTISVHGAARPGVPRMEDLIAAADEHASQAQVAKVPRDPFQVSILQLSGGTSGIPKLIPRFQNEYVYNMRAVAEFLDYRSTDVMLMPMPMIHNASMCCAWGPILLVGGAFLASRANTVEAMAADLRDFEPTWLGLGHREMILRCKDALRRVSIRRDKIRGVWAINSASLVRTELQLPSQHIFGMSEGMIMFTRADDPLDVRENTIGRPVSPFDRVRLLKPGTEIEVAEGEVGELAVKGPYTIHGYYDAAERNRAAFTSAGEYRSGDLMSVRIANGRRYYVYEGRIKDVIDRGGEKISSEEIELALSRHDGVAEVAVVGIPDARLGERLCACIIPRTSTDEGRLDVAQLGRFLKDIGVAKFKWPEHVQVYPEFPMTKIGKIDKSALRELAASRACAANSRPGATGMS
jgi:non-ribosomal peptide synthetase component E (peptide arylation enzyme)